MTAIIERNNKKVINGWAFFDWANSAYALVISSAIFPSYYLSYTDDFITVFGAEMSNSSLYSFAVAFSYLFIAALSPLLSGIADYSGRRMMFLKFFTLMGSMACIALFFFKGMPQLLLGTSGFILATIGFAGGLVFYDSYLPLIATEDKFNSVSAWGFSFGYIGSVILLVFNLLVITYPGWFGITDTQFAVRLAFVTVGLWWIGFAQISFRRLPKDSPIRNPGNLFRKGYQELRSVWQKVKGQASIKRFLIAFFFYNAGVQTVLYLAATFAGKELQFDTSELILLILILQLVAIGGAHLFAWISEARGNKFGLILMLCIWICICCMAYFVEGKLFFYFIAGLVGMVMGGIQSVSRSTYSKLIGERTDDLTSFFSFYDVLYKCSIVLGTFLFGYIDYISGGMRNSILGLVVLFVIGIVLLSFVDMRSIRRQKQGKEVMA